MTKEIEIQTDFAVMPITIDQKTHVELISKEPGKSKREALTYIHPSTVGSAKSPVGFVPLEYDFIEIGKAEDTDSYIYQSIFKRLSLGMAEGFSFVSRNRDALNYIEERLSQLEIVQGQTMWALVTEALGCLFRYHNCFIVKSRDEDNSGGRTRIVDEREIEPISELAVISPETMEIKVGKNNRPISYRQRMPDGRYRIYAASDVVHIHINKKPHFLAAAPSWQPVLADVAALRRIEEHVENLVHQHLYPLYQYIVGTELAPAQRYENGYTEIDEVKTYLRYMPSDGMVVTPERHKILQLSDGRVLRAEGYMEHFKNRVIAGSGMSQIDFGDGNTANRSTADTLSKLAVNNVKFYQQVLADDFNFHIIRELLLESSFGGDVLSRDNVVRMQFAEIDLETQIKVQNHYMLLYNGNMITRTHARNMSGWEALTEEEKGDLFLETVTMPEADKEAEGALALAKSKQQPSNQHKKNSGPSKAKSSRERDSRSRDLFDSLSSDLKNLPQDFLNLGSVRQLFFMTEAQMREDLQDRVRQSVFQGASGTLLTDSSFQELQNVSIKLEDQVRDDVSRVFKDCMSDTIASMMDGERTELPIDSVGYRIAFIERTLTHKGRVWGKATAGKLAGQNIVRVISNPDGDDYDEWDGTLFDLSQTSLERLPPFHPNCNCTIEIAQR